MEHKTRELCEDSELYQRNLAEYIGITQQTYSRYETGELNLSLETMAKLEEFYNTSVDYLMGLTDVRKPYKKAAL